MSEIEQLWRERRAAVLERLNQNARDLERLREEQRELLAEGHRLGIRATELAKASGLSRATVHRYLASQIAGEPIDR